MCIRDSAETNLAIGWNLNRIVSGINIRDTVGTTPGDSEGCLRREPARCSDNRQAPCLIDTDFICYALPGLLAIVIIFCDFKPGLHLAKRAMNQGSEHRQKTGHFTHSNGQKSSAESRSSDSKMPEKCAKRSNLVCDSGHFLQGLSLIHI